MITEVSPKPEISSSGDNRPSIVETLKRKRGRPSKEEETAKIKAELSAQSAPLVRDVFKPDMVEGITNLPFSMVAFFTKNPDWNLVDEDKKFISPALADWLNELWPELTGKYPRLAVLAVMTFGVVIKKSGEVLVKRKAAGESPVPERAKPKPAAVVEGDGLTEAERFFKDRVQAA